MASKFRPGVLFGDEVTELLNDANTNDYAIPAVNVVGTNTVNAALETARDVNSPVIIQFSNGGSAFYAGKGLNNADQKAAILGGISLSLIHIFTFCTISLLPIIALFGLMTDRDE